MPCMTRNISRAVIDWDLFSNRHGYPLEFPLTANRVTDRATTIGPYRVPQGTFIYLLFYSMYNSSSYWDAPTFFYPERWLTPEHTPSSQVHGTIAMADSRQAVLDDRCAMLALWCTVQWLWVESPGEDNSVMCLTFCSCCGNLKDEPLWNTGVKSFLLGRRQVQQPPHLIKPAKHFSPSAKEHEIALDR